MASTRFSDGRNLTRQQFLKIAGIFGAAVSSSSLLAACGSDEGPGVGFEGVTLRLAVEVGPALGNPIKPYVKEWEQQTGANVEFVEVPFAEIFPKLMSAFQARADEYDVAIILPTWLGDMAGRGFFEPLDDRIEGNERVAWNDILPRCQDIHVWEGQTYIVPLDCDVFMSFYNRQFLEDPEHQEAFQQEYGYPLAPPVTWTQYRDILEFDVGDIRAQFPQGDAALALDWASIGMIPPDRTNQEVIGFQRIPGSNEVYNHETGERTELDEPNRVPFMAANGWGAAIPVTSPEM